MQGELWMYREDLLNDYYSSSAQTGGQEAQGKCFKGLSKTEQSTNHASWHISWEHQQHLTAHNLGLYNQ